MITVRISEYTDLPCPGKSFHGCADPTHPVAVHIMNINSLKDSEIVLNPNTTKITVSIVNSQAHGI